MVNEKWGQFLKGMWDHMLWLLTLSLFSHLKSSSLPPFTLIPTGYLAFSFQWEKIETIRKKHQVALTISNLLPTSLYIQHETSWLGLFAFLQWCLAMWVQECTRRSTVLTRVGVLLDEDDGGCSRKGQNNYKLKTDTFHSFWLLKV